MRRNQLILTLLTGAILLLQFTTSQAQVTISKTAARVTIGNAYLSRSFSVSDNKLLPGAWTDLRTGGSGTTFTPGKGSEEFVIRPVMTTPTPTPLSRTGWTATVDSWQVDGTDGNPKYIIDGNVQTKWHSNYGGGTGSQALPHWMQFDLGSAQTFRSFGYVPRQSGDNGTFKEFKLYASNDLTTLTDDSNLVMTGSLNMNGTSAVWVNLPSVVTARYVRMVEVSSQNGYAFGSCAEFYLSAGTYDESSSLICASALTLQGVTDEAFTGGHRITFDMAPYHFNGVDWDIDMVVEMMDTAHFLHKYLKIAAPTAQQAAARIDYIDLEHYNVSEAAFKWSHPSMGSGVGGMSGYLISLGQPVYTDGLFVGSEFPETDNAITDSIAHVRYFSGKSLQQLAAEGRMKSGSFSTWKAVTGASRSNNDMDVIQADFFSYIQSIQRPTHLRIQYNSWYDWMMSITESNILNSFREMERGLTQNGVRPLDSYVIDDGWNAYGPWASENTSGFWQFNSKFPRAALLPADFAHKESSNFGMWLGPRGGYNYSYDFAKFLEQKGNGTYNSNNGDIVTGDKVYVSKLKDFFLKQQADYNINYWKIDGLCAVVPQASTNGRYISGGTNGMYYVTEHWERWTAMLDSMYLDAASRGSNLWVNLTCYVNPSPWLLQWCNSVWLQVSTDMGRTAVDGRTNDMDQMLNYRAGRYFDFIKTRQFQFPFSNIFNHDPSYGKTGCVSANAMDNDQFRAYLYMMATRGTAFWEMLYSYTLLNEGEKWMVNAETLKFLENNYDILRHSRLIGANPENGNVYGYSCWNDREGIISLRNPKNSSQTFSLKLDRTIGVPEGASGLHRTLVMKYNHAAAFSDNTLYNYGTTLNVTLGAGEVLICKFSPEQDTVAASVVAVRCNDDSLHMELEMDEPVSALASHFAIMQGEKVYTTARSVTMAADLRTVRLTLSKALQSDSLYQVKLLSLPDWQGNKSVSLSPAFYYNKEAVIASASLMSQLEGGGSDVSLSARPLNKRYPLLSRKSFNGEGDFNVSFTLSTTATEGVLMQQEGAYSVSLVNGRLCFRVGRLTLQTDSAVNDGQGHSISCCREKNGMLKVYVDGALMQSCYDKTCINEALPAGQISVGSESLDSHVGRLSILNRALSYREIQDALLTNDSLIALSVLDLSKGTNGNEMPISSNTSVRGTDLLLKGVKYTVGIGMQSPARLNIRINGATRFRAIVGIDDNADPYYGNTVGKYGLCDYKILKNGKVWYTKHLDRRDTTTDTLDIDVTGWKYLTIQVVDGSDGTPWADIPDFVDAWFTYANVPPITETDAEMTSGLVGIEMLTGNETEVTFAVSNGCVVARWAADDIKTRKLLEVFDMSGRKVDEVQGDDVRMFSHPLAKGLYIVRATSGHLVVSNKISVGR